MVLCQIESQNRIGFWIDEHLIKRESTTNHEQR